VSGGCRGVLPRGSPGRRRPTPWSGRARTARRKRGRGRTGRWGGAKERSWEIGGVYAGPETNGRESYRETAAVGTSFAEDAPVRGGPNREIRLPQGRGIRTSVVDERAAVRAMSALPQLVRIGGWRQGRALVPDALAGSRAAGHRSRLSAFATERLWATSLARFARKSWREDRLRGSGGLHDLAIRNLFVDRRLVCVCATEVAQSATERVTKSARPALPVGA
jgi:hypothetical protein